MAKRDDYDSDFEDVYYYEEPDPFDINIKLNDYDDLPYDSLEELDADDDIDDELREKLRRKLIRGRRIHRDINITKVVFTFIFIGVIAYLAYFNFVKADEYKSSEYNALRQSIYRDRFIRGNIISADGKLLATTKINDDGSETRSYPFAEIFAHSVGYSTKGNTGVEAIANSYLLNSHINPVDIARNEIEGKKTNGDSAVTTLRTDLQQTAFDALGSKKGAVIAMNVKTGAVLAMVSKPDYDPNYINEIWDELVSDNTKSNLLNRATQGLYPPGSTFKIATTLEFIRENNSTYNSFKYNCSSHLDVEEYSIKCFGSTAHGELDLPTAFAYSCNGAFAQIGLDLDADRFHDLCEELGFNASVNTELGCATSKFDLTDDNATTWSRLQTAIGQGSTLITPIQNLLITSAIANGGTAMKPYIVSEIDDAYGNVYKIFDGEKDKKIMSTSEAKILSEYMRKVVTDGTGSNAQGDNYTVAGKTGSAEWNENKDTHAWFVGFAPYENPEIAICVLVEEGGSGGSAAAPIARAVFDTYFK